MIDPRTGGMSTSDLVQVTVVASSACEAETTATTALLMNSAEACGWLRSLDLTGVLLTRDADLFTDEEPDHG